ncbi:M28 family peptidase [Microcoleus sp. FACHB-1515]|uniref:M28 family peptidase n=1 Tax=Cyanophyceae TaxID=3028117 RepID=UPI001689165C|nr:M28 family peptidase [Microcoleus sp. FACHB-1515]MBD2088789.1 M28 family peptidase [Microcoleus sp. FACHB-1515]
MKRSIWVAFGLAVFLSLAIAWQWKWSPRPQAIEVNFAQAQINPPTLNADRLWNDLRSLAFRRYAGIDRSRARRYILRSLTEAGWTPQAQTFAQGVNIVAERLGTNPAAGKILLGAHYDSVATSPGADDNATAVATVLEAARLFSTIDTPRSLQLVLFDEEETGLLGSSAFVDRLQSDELQGAVILEMLGYACYESGCQQYPGNLPIDPPTDRGDFLAILGDRGHMPLIHSFEQAQRSNLPPIVTLPVPLARFLPPDLLRSDHAPFWKNGFGAVLVTDTANFRTPHYHQPSDTIDTIDRSFFTGAAQLVVNALTTLLQDELSGA